jgi:hypothetical protein
MLLQFTENHVSLAVNSYLYYAYFPPASPKINFITTFTEPWTTITYGRLKCDTRGIRIRDT